MSMADRDGFIWYNGEMVDWRSATTHVLTHTLHYGMGVFEGVRAYETADGPAIFRLQDHTDRLFRSAHILGIKLPYSKEEINRAHHEVVKANKLASCYFRPMAFYGSGNGAPTWVTKPLNRVFASRPRRSRATMSTLPCARPRPTATT